jgi:hypothetical protein
VGLDLLQFVPSSFPARNYQTSSPGRPRIVAGYSPHASNHSAVQHSAYVQTRGRRDHHTFGFVTVRRCRLPLIPCLLPSIRIEELTNCLPPLPTPQGYSFTRAPASIGLRHRLTPITTFLLATDEFQMTNHHHHSHSLPLQMLPPQDRLSPYSHSLPLPPHESHPGIKRTAEARCPSPASPDSQACLFGTTLPTSATFMILHSSPRHLPPSPSRYTTTTLVKLPPNCERV